ncbi:MAG: transaldolase, partial [bacterium]|nr:transaldolase [bacterium]
PEPALEAFIDHGEVRRTLDAGLEDARGRLDELARLGIDLGRVTDELEEEGVRAFAKSYDELEQTISGEAQKVRGAGSG